MCWGFFFICFYLLLHGWRWRACWSCVSAMLILLLCPSVSILTVSYILKHIWKCWDMYSCIHNFDLTSPLEFLYSILSTYEIILTLKLQLSCIISTHLHRQNIQIKHTKEIKWTNHTSEISTTSNLRTTSKQRTSGNCTQNDALCEHVWWAGACVWETRIWISSENRVSTNSFVLSLYAVGHHRDSHTDLDRKCMKIPWVTQGMILQQENLLQTSPMWKASEQLQTFDVLVCCSLQVIHNIKMNSAIWAQDTLPTSKGGLGVRCSVDLWQFQPSLLHLLQLPT